jgi:XRE family transcriptional regulator, master regulator for biofilm formation
MRKEQEKRLKNFGEYLFKMRMDKGLSLTELGRLVGISANYAGELERGKKENPSDEILRNLAEVYEVPEETLFALLDRVPLGIKEEFEMSPELQELLNEISLNKKLPEDKKKVLYKQILTYYESLLKDEN